MRVAQADLQRVRPSVGRVNRIIPGTACRFKTDLLERAAFGLRIEEPIAGKSNDIEYKENIEVFEFDCIECVGRELRKDEIDNLCTISENVPYVWCLEVITQLLMVVIALPRARASTGKISAGYTQEMIPNGV